MPADETLPEPVRHTCSALRVCSSLTLSLTVSTRYLTRYQHAASQHSTSQQGTRHRATSDHLHVTSHLLHATYAYVTHHHACTCRLLACVASFDNFDAPTDETVYCPGECTSATCRQLAAGCGVSLFDLTGQANGGDGNWRVGRNTQTDWDEHACSRQQLVAGQCDACTMPYWCRRNARLTTLSPPHSIRAGRPSPPHRDGHMQHTAAESVHDF
jgi:hypothetical protein